MNFSPYELHAAHARLDALRKQAAEDRLARSVKTARKARNQG
ncbi:hypothetical protein [Catenulispora subtropica]|uniref:Uncharacterized protein n=1 Tax=Catenulispora subtropica TaxID=450798 RepID=A0ABP5DGQ0_9ACTN